MDRYVTEQNLDTLTDKWLKQVAPFNMHNLTLNVPRSALMIIDMQDFFLDPESPTFTCGGLAIIPNILKIRQAFRRAARPVIYTRHVHNPDGSDAGIMGWWWEGMCKEGTPESEITAPLRPDEKDIIVNKHRYSAFYNTDLETILRCGKIEDLVITGIMTNMCCESTARDAYYRDYRVFFPADATGSINEEMHLASLLNLSFGFAHINRTDDIISDIRNSKRIAEGRPGEIEKV